MALYSNLRDYQFGSAAEDIRGANVYGANNEKLGDIDDVIFDVRTGDVRYVVVDSGGWLSAMKFVVPARQLMTREEGENDFRVNLTKDQVRKLPEYNESDLESEERWSNYENRYEAAWVEDPVMHREGSTHMVTPDPAEERTSSTSVAAGIDPRKATPRRIAHDLPRFGATSNTEDPIEEGNLAGEIDWEPVSSEYTGVDAVIPLQVEEEEPIVLGDRSKKEEKVSSERRSEKEIPTPPAEKEKMDSGRAPVADPSRYSPEGGRRFREFQEKLRKERDEILRRRKEEAA
jgi:sporulation protein YlmC with PRC-barrel domain